MTKAEMEAFKRWIDTLDDNAMQILERYLEALLRKTEDSTDNRS